MAAAVAAGLGVSSLAAPAADAALITLDVRLPGGGKSVVKNAGDASPVTVEVYAQVQNNDDNRANDGFLQSQWSMLSADSGLLGDMVAMTLNTNPPGFLSSTLSQAGTAQNLDVNATDNEVGGIDPGSSTGWIIANVGLAPQMSSGAGSGPTEFFLGTTTWTPEGVVAPGSSTSINAGLRQSISTASAGRTYKFTSDGTVYDVRWDGRTATGTFVTDAVGLGSPLVVSVVPEPAALGLLGVAGLAALRRRRPA